MVAHRSLRGAGDAILGGQAKAYRSTDLAEFVAGRPNVKQVIAIGETGPEIAALLRKHGFDHITDGGTDMRKSWTWPGSRPEPGDVVLLSSRQRQF